MLPEIRTKKNRNQSHKKRHIRVLDAAEHHESCGCETHAVLSSLPAPELVDAGAQANLQLPQRHRDVVWIASSLSPIIDDDEKSEEGAELGDINDVDMVCEEFIERSGNCEDI